MSNFGQSEIGERLISRSPKLAIFQLFAQAALSIYELVVNLETSPLAEVLLQASCCEFGVMEEDTAFYSMSYINCPTLDSLR